MFRKTNISTNQKVTAEDFNDFGNHPREAMDYLVRDLGGWTAGRYAGFLVEQAGLSTVRIGTGRFYNAAGIGFIFDPQGGQTIDLLDHLPAVAKRVATIVVYGNTVDTDIQPRTFLIDPETRATEGREVATESRRQAYAGFLLGVENPTPSAPAIPSDYVAIAHVILTPAGVESITQLTANKVTSTYRNGEEISLINNRLNAVGPQIDTLRTDISGLAASLRGKADQYFVSHLALDMARVKERIDLPDDYTAYGADHFLDERECDVDHPDYDCLVREGAHFPSVASAVARLALENAIDPKVTVNDNMVMPKYSVTPRLSIVGNDGEYPLTNTTTETITLREMKETRMVREFLGVKRICSNRSWWKSGIYDPITGIFTRGGETFLVSNGNLPPSSTPDFVTGKLTFGNISLHRYIEYEVTDTHWEEVSTDTSVSGSVAGQTVLHSQDGFLAQHAFFVTKKAISGDIRVVICEVDDADNPMLHRVLAQVVVANAQIKVWPEATVAAFKPIFVPKGKRTARVYLSSAGHFLAVVAENKLAQGAMHYIVDGAWVQSTIGQDFAFEDRYCQFESPVVTVQLQPLELAGGINSIRINCDTALPDATDIEFRIRVAGEWRSLREGMQDVNILSTLPSLVQFQAVLVGTTDVMPAFGVGPNRSEVLLDRPKTALTVVSTPRLMPAPVDTIELHLLLENWDEGVGKHSITGTVLTGVGYATVETADVVSSVPAPGDPTARVIKMTFNIAAPTSAFKFKLVGASGTSPQRFHVAERADIEFA